MRKIIEYSREEIHNFCSKCQGIFKKVTKLKSVHQIQYFISDKNEKREIYYSLDRCSSCKKIRFHKSRKKPWVRPKKMIFIHGSNHRLYFAEMRNKWNRKISKKDKKLFCRYFPELKEYLVH